MIVFIELIIVTVFSLSHLPSFVKRFWRNNYEFRLKAIRDEADAIEYKTKQAKEEGIREGLERGAKRRTEEMVKEMLKNNFTIEQIEIITKLTKEEIERLKNEI